MGFYSETLVVMMRLLKMLKGKTMSAALSFEGAFNYETLRPINMIVLNRYAVAFSRMN